MNQSSAPSGRGVDPVRRTFGALGWAAAQGWSAQLFSLVVYVVLGRLLAPEDFGLAALAALYVMLTTVVVDQGLQITLVQREHLDDEHVNAAWWTNVCVAVALTGLTWAIAPALARLFEEPELASVLRWLCPAILVRSFGSVHSGVLQREMDFRSLAIRTALALFVGGSAGVAVGLAGGGVWALVVYQSVITFVQTAVLILRSPWRPRLGFRPAKLGELSGFARFVLGSELLGFLNRQADSLVIGYFLGITALGYYTVALRLMTIVRMLMAGVGQAVALSAFSSLQRDAARFRAAYLTALELCGLAASPALAGLALLAPAVLTISMGAKWVESAPLLTILCVAGWFEAMALFAVQTLTASGQPEVRLKLDATAVVLRTAGYAAFVGSGLAAIAWVYLVVAVAFMVLPTHLACRTLDLSRREAVARLAPSVVAAGCMALALIAARAWLPAPGDGLVGLASHVGLGATAYALALAILFPRRVSALRHALIELRAGRASKGDEHPAPPDAPVRSPDLRKRT